MSLTRLRGESAAAFEAFANYAIMSDGKSIEEFAKANNHRISRICNWAEKWRWNERLNGYGNKNDSDLSQNDSISQVNKELCKEHAGLKADCVPIKLENVVQSAEQQFLESADCMQKVIETLNGKIRDSVKEMQDMPLEAFLKLATSITKLYPEVLNSAMAVLTEARKRAQSDSKANFAEIIRSDSKALSLATGLLERISKLNEESEETLDSQ